MLHNEKSNESEIKSNESEMDLINRSGIERHDYLVPDGDGKYHTERIAYKSQIDDFPSANLQPTCNLASNDCISRQAAIDALRYAQHRFTVADEAGGMGTVKWSEDVIYFAAAERILTELPPAQLDTPTNTPNTPTNTPTDCISRKAAIDAVCNAGCNSGFCGVECDEVLALRNMPSAQPYTEAEIQTMQDLYQAEIDKAFELGQEDARSEIIHCGECKHRDPEDHKCDCGHDILWQLPRDDKWYCADAERRSDD